MHPRVTTVAAARYWFRAVLLLAGVAACTVFVVQFLGLLAGQSIIYTVQRNPATGSFDSPALAWNTNAYRILHQGVLAKAWWLALAGSLLVIRRWIVPWVLPMPKPACPNCSYTRTADAAACPECGLRFDKPEAANKPNDAD